MLPLDAAIAFVERHRARNDARFAGAVGHHGVEHGAIRGAIHTHAQGTRRHAQTQFAHVEAVAEKPAGGGVAIGHHHFGERPAIHHRPHLAAVFVTHGVEHHAFARLERVAETPLLPVHFAVLDPEARAVRLAYRERRGRGPQRARIEVGILARDRHVVVDVQKIENLAGGQVDVRHHALHGMRVEVLTGAGVVRDHAHHAALIGARQSEIAGGPRHGHHAVDVADAVIAQGLRPARVGADDLVGQFGILAVDGRLRAGDLLPGIDRAGGEVGDGLECVVGGVIVDDGEGAARHAGLGQHLSLGRLIEGEDAEFPVGGKARRISQDARGGADLIGGERGKWKRSGGRGSGCDQEKDGRVRDNAPHDHGCPWGPWYRTRSASLFDGAERRETTVLVEHFDLAKARARQQVELPEQRAGSVFGLDIGEDAVAVRGACERLQVVAIAPPHDVLHGGRLVRHDVGDPERAAGNERAVHGGENALPFLLAAEVVEGGAGDCDVEGRAGQRGLADVALNRRDRDCRSGRLDALGGAVEHVAAEIDQGHGAQREVLEKLEGVIARAAADIEERARLGPHAAHRARNQFERQRRVDGGRLSGFEVGEALDVGIESPANFLGRGFAGGHIVIMARARRGLPSYGNLPYTREGDLRMPKTIQRTRTRKPQPRPAKTYRFDARLNEEQKLLIQRAADLEGRTMTDFVLHSAEVAAEQTIEKRAMLVLSARDAEVFVDAILNPRGPGPVLRKAALEYLDKMGLR